MLFRSKTEDSGRKKNKQEKKNKPKSDDHEEQYMVLDQSASKQKPLFENLDKAIPGGSILMEEEPADDDDTMVDFFADDEEEKTEKPEASESQTVTMSFFNTENDERQEYVFGETVHNAEEEPEDPYSDASEEPDNDFEAYSFDDDFWT